MNIIKNITLISLTISIFISTGAFADDRVLTNAAKQNVVDSNVRDNLRHNAIKKDIVTGNMKGDLRRKEIIRKKIKSHIKQNKEKQLLKKPM